MNPLSHPAVKRNELTRKSFLKVNFHRTVRLRLWGENVQWLNRKYIFFGD